LRVARRFRTRRIARYGPGPIASIVPRGRFIPGSTTFWRRATGILRKQRRGGEHADQHES
jgi:hypothetical protein